MWCARRFARVFRVLKRNYLQLCDCTSASTVKICHFQLNSQHPIKTISSIKLHSLIFESNWMLLFCDRNFWQPQKPRRENSELIQCYSRYSAMQAMCIAYARFIVTLYLSASMCVCISRRNAALSIRTPIEIPFIVSRFAFNCLCNAQWELARCLCGRAQIKTVTMLTFSIRSMPRITYTCVDLW